MEYIYKYKSPIGEIVLLSDTKYLNGLWIKGQKNFDIAINNYEENENLEIFKQTAKWLDIFFEGKDPKKELPLKFKGTPFQEEVWKVLTKIPYGKYITYGDIARKIAKSRGLNKMSAQAVGGAVGSNPISIIIPCHRVIGKDGNLVGYAGGLDLKIKLLKIENINTNNFYILKDKKKQKI